MGLPGRGRGFEAQAGLPISKKVITLTKRTLCFTRVFGVSYSRAIGSPAQPVAAYGTGSSVATRRASGSKSPSPAGFGAFALLDGLGLTRFRV